MRPMGACGPPTVIQTGPAPGFKALVNDPLLEGAQNYNWALPGKKSQQEPCS